MTPQAWRCASSRRRWVIDRIGRYEVVRVLGAGAMGEVYLAKDERLGRQVAIKVIAPGSTSPIPRAARPLPARGAVGVGAESPNVCVVHEIGETEDGRPFIAMEYLQGRNLDEMIGSGGIAVAQAVDIARQIADALDAAHEAGIIHRDIKPSNMNVDDRGRVKVLDFGLAKRVGSEADAEAARMTQAGTVLGSPAYMSPEQALARPMDHRTDLFSLGTLLYELLTGHVPFAGSSLGDTIHRLLHDSPSAIARYNYDVPPELERIVLKLLSAKDPRSRYQTAREVYVDLGELSASQGGETRPRSGPAAVPAAVATGSSAVYGRAPTPSAPPVDPRRLSESDVVIAYAELDDVPVAEGRSGWISQLHRNLELRISQLSGDGDRPAATSADEAPRSRP